MEQQQSNQGNNGQVTQEWDTYSIFQVVAYAVITLAMAAFFVYLIYYGI